MLPILFQSPELVIYSYPLLMGLGWGVGYQVFFANIPAAYSRFETQILFWGLFIFAWIGAKLLFYLSVPSDISRELLSSFSFWTGGGLVFFGGLLGGLVYLAIYHWLVKKMSAPLVWSMLPALALGHAIGRFGCLLAGCCFGAPTDCWWGIYLHQEYRHPTQLLEALTLLALSFYLLRSTRDKMTLIAHYLLIYGGARLLVEFLRGDEIRGQWGSLTPSQWISLALLLAGIALPWYDRKFRLLAADQAN